MLHVFTGTDREKARAAMSAAVKKSNKGASIVRIHDANTVADFASALQGKGMFDGERIVVLDGIGTNDEMRALLEREIAHIAKAEEKFFLLEEKPDAALRKLLEKYANTYEKFEAAKGEKEDNFFSLVNSLRAGKKKELWVLLQRELSTGKAPEMLHGAFFWAAKQMVLKPRSTQESSRGKELVGQLAALPHEARHRGEELEYALERFVLSSLAP